MRKLLLLRLRDAIIKALASQIERTLDVARIRGWKFTSKYDVGLTVIEASPVASRIRARMDEVAVEATIANTDVATGVVKVSDDLIAEWLVLHAQKPPRRRRAAA